MVRVVRRDNKSYSLLSGGDIWTIMCRQSWGGQNAHLPQYKIFGEHCILGSINTFDVNDFLQVVDVNDNVKRESDLERFMIA